MKVSLDADRFAFVKSGTLQEGGRATDWPALTTIYSHAPPKLEVSAAAMATRDDKIDIRVEATDSERLLDVYMFVGARKLYYQSNRNSSDPRQAAFSLAAPLEPGVNLITVVARESPDTATRRTVIVRRDGADGSVLKTPKTQEDYLLDAVE